MTATPNEIPSVTVTACSEIRLRQGSETAQTCTYQVKIYPGTALPVKANSYIEIEIPKEIDIVSVTDVVQYSYTEGVEDSKRKVTLNDRIIRFDKIFSSASPTKTEYSLDMFSIYIGALKTPRTTEPTSSFKVKIYSEDGYLQYKKDSLATSQVTQAKSFDKVVILRSSEINGAKNCSYEFTINITLPLYRNEFIKIVPPPSVKFGSSKDQCVGLENLQRSLSCSLNNQSLFLTVVPQGGLQLIPAGKTLRFQVSNIDNPLSLEPTVSFQIFSTSSRLYDYRINQMTTGLSIMNRQPNFLNDVSIIPDTNLLGSVTAYSFYFTTGTQLEDKTMIEVEFSETQFGQSLFNTNQIIGCYNIKNLDNTLQCKVKSGQKNVVQISNGIVGRIIDTGRQVAFKLNGIKNPAKSSSGNDDQIIVVRTISQSGYVIDKSGSNSFKIGCIFPCATCSNDQNSCTSCIQDVSLSISNSLYLYGKTCGKTCPTGYYQDSLNVCQKCSYPCNTCIFNATNCTSCMKNSQTPLLNPYDMKCYSGCPSGTYSSEMNQMCEPCSQNCKECISKPDKCTQCRQSEFFWENKCFKQCPNVTIPISQNQIKECQNCKSPCLTCYGTKDNCTSCSVNPVLHYKFQETCVTQCPRTYLPNIQNVCTKQDEATYPFLSLILTGLTLIIVIASNLIYPNTRMFSAYLALQSLAMIPIWIYLIVFLSKDGHTSSLGLVAIGLISNLFINYGWHKYYKTKIVLLDFGYQRYMKEYPRTHSLILSLTCLFTFQFFRLQYSRLFNAQSLSCTLQLKDKFYKKLNRYTLLQLTFVYLPIIAANIYNLQWTWFGRQVFWIDIECIITSSILWIAHVVVIVRTEQLFVQDKYAPSSQLISVRDQTQVLPQHDTTNITQINGGVAGLQMKSLTDMEVSQSIEGLEDEFEDIMRQGGKSPNKKLHRVINDKQYVTLGVMQDGMLYRSTSKEGEGHPSDIKRNSKVRYDRVQQDTTRTLGEKNGPGLDDVDERGILNELEYTSAPIAVEKVLKENSPARRKLKKFQEELEDIQNERGRKQKKSPKRGSNIKGNSVEKKKSRSKSKTKVKSGNTIVKSRSNEKTATTAKAEKVGGRVQRENQLYVGEGSSQVIKSNKPMTEQTYKNGKIKPHILPSTNPIVVQQSESTPEVVNQEPQINTISQIIQDYASMILQNTASLTQNINDEIQPVATSKPRKSVAGYVDQQQVELLVQEILQISHQGEQDGQILNTITQDNEALLNLIQDESIKKEELQIVVEDLNEHIATLLQAFNEAVQTREEELAIIENGNFTSDEEQMGISPNTYNKENNTNIPQGNLQPVTMTPTHEPMNERKRRGKQRKKSKGKKSKSKSPTRKGKTQEDRGDSNEKEEKIDSKLKTQSLAEPFFSDQKSNKTNDEFIEILNQRKKDENNDHLLKSAQITSGNGINESQGKIVNHIEDIKMPRQKSQTRENPRKKQQNLISETKPKTASLPPNSRRKVVNKPEPSKSPEPKTERTKSKRSVKSKKSAPQDEEPPEEVSQVPRKKRVLRKKKKKVTEEEEPSSKKYLKKKRRRRFLKKKKRKSKKGKRKGKKKKGKGRSKKGKKGVKKSQKKKLKVDDRAQPELQTVEILQDSIIPVEINEYQDVDQLSISMTHSEFVRMLEEESGAYILEDLTEQLREIYQDQLEQTGFILTKDFNNIAKKRLKNLAVKNPSPEKKKLREFIVDLNALGKQHIQEFQTSQQDSILHDTEQLNIPGTFENNSEEEKGSYEEVMELESNIGVDFQNGLPTNDGLLPKTRLVKKKKGKLLQDQTSSKSYDAYFKYLPFEKAVIESKGKAPYSNREIEQMSALINKGPHLNSDLKK